MVRSIPQLYRIAAEITSAQNDFAASFYPGVIEPLSLLVTGYIGSNGCPYRKSNPDVLMAQRSQERLGNDAANGLDRPRNRCILAQR